MASAFGNLNGSGNHQIWVSLKYRNYSQSGNYSNWDYELRYYGNGWGSWTNGTQYWSLSGFGSVSGTFTIPYSERYNTYTVLRKGTFRKNHDSNGRLSAGTLTGKINTNHSSIGDGSVSVSSGTPPRIPRAPGKPSKPTFRSATTTSISFGITQPDNGGSPISTYDLQAARNSSFTTGLVAWQSGSSNQVASPLNPGSQYWIRYRAKNSVGTGPWSDALSASTLPSVAPAMAVTPSISGTSASVVMGGSGTSPTSYRLQYRPVGGTTTTRDSVSSTITITGLTPGRSYEWRSQAFVNEYQSPWTSWTTVTQPQPNANPGDYFDGSTQARQDITFAWTGTANNSISEARGVSALGWVSLTTSGTQLQRVSGGRFGSYFARMLVTSDEPYASAYSLGIANTPEHRAEIAEGGLYVTSVYVRPSRPQRLQLRAFYVNAAGSQLEVASSPETVITDTTGWTRLSATGIAPLGAVGLRFVVFARGTGEGGALWSGGDHLDADGAMVTMGSLYDYFDGSTRAANGFSYEWLGTPNASVSMRKEAPAGSVNPLADPDCAPIPLPPRPPSVEDSCIEQTGSWRRYWAIIPEGEVFDWLSVVPTITLTTGDIAARQVRIRFYANPDSLDPADVGELPVESEQIVSYLPPNTELTLDGVSRRAWASVDGREQVTAAHLLYGAGGGPATWPTLDCGSAYLVSFDVPLDAPAGNLSVGVDLTTRMM